MDRRLFILAFLFIASCHVQEGKGKSVQKREVDTGTTHNKEAKEEELQKNKSDDSFLDDVSEELTEEELLEDEKEYEENTEVNSENNSDAEEKIEDQSYSDEEDLDSYRNSESEDEDEDTRRKRSAAADNGVLLNNPDHPLQIRMVNLLTPSSLGHRVKRTSFNISKFMWTHRIPYIIEFKDPARRLRLRRVLDYIEDRLCVQFFDEEDRFITSNPHWFTENGYKTDAYMSFDDRAGAGCKGAYGQGRRKMGPRKTYPCFDYMSMLHETMHAMGGHHAQKMPRREKYITVHNVNIHQKQRKQYKMTPEQGQVNFGHFDSSSVLMYGKGFFDSNGLDTYNYLRPEMGHLKGMRSTQTLMYEMTQNYKCAETFCKGVNIDCGDGYLTYIRGRCVCICPDRYDPDTNCARLIEKVQGPASWPDTPYTLYKAGNSCPDGMESGTIPIRGKMVPEQTGIPLPASEKTLNIEVCTKTWPRENINWNQWPMGSYCIGKVAGVSCEIPFYETSFVMKTTGALSLIGSVGDVTTDKGIYVTVKFCCYEKSPIIKPMSLPTKEPFRLLMGKGDACQAVEGMWPVKTTIKTQVKTEVVGLKPAITLYRNYFTHSSCYYVPATYECNEIFTLGEGKRLVKFTLPRVESHREPNKRCFYAFKAPPNSRLRLTFHKFNIHPDDKFYVKRFHPWTNPSRVMSDSQLRQIITEKNYLFIEYWSSPAVDTAYDGAKLTVDLLLDDEMCYNAATRGADYAGDKAVSETYEDCVAWKDSFSCPDFPWTHVLQLLNSGRKCRNLDTKSMLQPWCYTLVKGKMCVRRYCDVCNEAKPIDLIPGCKERLKDNPDSCSIPFFENNCFRSCRGQIHFYKKRSVKCSRPNVPPEVIVQGNLLDSYNAGSSISVSCNGNPSQITCTTHGWTPFDVKCNELCIDRSQLCKKAMREFPEFCTQASSRKIASDFCKMSCGLCKPGACSVSNGATYSAIRNSGDGSTGHAVEFACHNGFTLASGDLIRACSDTGSFLGKEPVCQAGNLPVDINQDSIIPRLKTTKFIHNMAVLMLRSDLRVPFDGKISAWYHYCRNNEDIYFLVYRKTDTDGKFKKIGYNKAKCVKDRPSTSEVPEEDQVSVMKGDILGVYQPSTSFSQGICGGSEAPVVLRKRIETPSDLLNVDTVEFPESACLHLSIGARVVPSA